MIPYPLELFQSTLSLRRATRFRPSVPCFWIFQSTLSLRRATKRFFLSSPRADISIHALLAESDYESLERRQYDRISIHALLAESDGSYIPAEEA